jgi:DNA ligase (NAD+)
VAKGENLLEIEGIGSKTSQAIVTFFRQKQTQRLLEELRYFGVLGVSEAVDSHKPQAFSFFKDKSFVITGILEHYTREEAENLIRRLGGRPSGSVSKKTSFVIVGENPGSKLDKARGFGIPELSAREFEVKLRNYQTEASGDK